MKYFALLAALVLVVACGSTNHPGFIDDNVGGSGGGSAGSGHAGGTGHAGATSAGSGGDAGEGGGTDVNPLAPLVSIVSPTEVTDPNVGPVVLDTVRVLCNATKSTAALATIATSTVSIEAFGADGKSIQKVDGTPNVEDVNQFYADFTLTPTTAPNGAISFKCSVSDLSTPANVGTAIVNTFIDHGPTISVMSPALPSSKGVLDYYALSTAVPFRFTVTPAPLSASDKQAAVDGVTLTVDSQVIDLSDAEDPNNKGSYKVDIKLNDPSVFKTTPSGAVPVEITATNKRSPLPSGVSAPLTATTDYNFGIDGTGPVITIVSPSPLNAPVVGVSVKLQFTVTDAESGEDPTSVSITLNNGGDAKVYDPANTSWTKSGDAYTYTVANTTLLNGSKIQLTVAISAKDLAKNASLPTTAQYWLDTTPPIVDLDPPSLEELRPTGSGTGYYCSDNFDVLGPASPSDGDTILSADICRALVWDETNVTSGEPVLHYAGVDPTTVRLYAQDSATQPLLIDTDGDGNCDALATAGTSGVTHPPVPFQLDALDATGSANYTTTSPVIAGACSDVASNSAPQPRLCLPDHNSDMIRVIDHAISGVKEDVVYTVTSSAATECTGKAVDLGGNLATGWVCLAAEADDLAGNHGISAPIRVCLTSDANPSPPCANSSVAKPTCVASCTPPGHFDAEFVTRAN